MRRVAVLFMSLVFLAMPRLALAFGFGSSNLQDGGQPGEFLQVASGARALAMGGAHTAIAEDASAPFWNASGLAQIQRYDVVTYYSRLGTDAALGSGAFALPTRGFGTFAINAVTLHAGSFQRRDAANNDLGGFSDNASALLLSQGLNFGPRWSAGYTVKAIREQIAEFSDTGYGADVGFLVRPQALWQFGLAVQNLAQPALRLKSETERYPRQVRLGSRYEALKNLTLAADLSATSGQAAELSLGTEWRVAAPLAFRVGVNDREFAAGFGFTAGDASIDYAFGLPHASVVRDDLGDTQRITFHLKFGSNVMAGSYRDLARREKEQRTELVQAHTGYDNVKVLKDRMRTWNGKLDAETFAQVQAARASLREVAFTDPTRSLEAQAYITQFQGRFVESARLFDRLVRAEPGNRRLEEDDVLAHVRARDLHRGQQLAAAYDRLDAAERRRQKQAVELVRAAESNAIGGGAGASQETPVRGGGAMKAQQVAFLPMPMPPINATRPRIQRPAPPVVRPPVTPPAPAVRPAPVRAAPRPVPAPPPPPPAARPEIVRAQRSFARGEYVQSHLVTRKLLEANPNDREAARQEILTNAVVAAQATILDPKETVDIPSLQKQVNRSLALYDRGMAFYRAHRREEAEMAWDAAVQACPGNFLARNMLKKAEEEKFNERWDAILDRANGKG